MKGGFIIVVVVGVAGALWLPSISLMVLLLYFEQI